MAKMNFAKQKEKYLKLIEDALDDVLPPINKEPCSLHIAMRDAVGSGGKRIRPLICIGAALACGGKPEDAVYAAAAIELLHNYTLVHDDLPSMDNDEMRRGKPTIWKVHGEANAILVGDALQSLAFKTVHSYYEAYDSLYDALSDAAVEVIEGQVMDIEGCAGKEKSTACDAALMTTYLHKTASLFIAAARMGAAAADGSEDCLDILHCVGYYVGMAFQFQDDLIDGDSFISNDVLEALVEKCMSDAMEKLDLLPGDTSFLKTLVLNLAGRKK